MTFSLGLITLTLYAADLLQCLMIFFCLDEINDGYRPCASGEVPRRAEVIPIGCQDVAALAYVDWENDIMQVPGCSKFAGNGAP